MGKEITFDYSKAAGFISAEEMANFKTTVMSAKETLLNKSGAGNDFLGWIDLPVDYDKEDVYKRQVFGSQHHRDCHKSSLGENHVRFITL